MERRRNLSRNLSGAEFLKFRAVREIKLYRRDLNSL